MGVHEKRLDLDAIEARANAATAGPWLATTVDSIAGGTIYDAQWSIASATIYPRGETGRDGLMPGVPDPLTPSYIDESATDANARFIAHARQDVPDLIQALRSTQAKLAKAQEALASKKLET